MRRHPALCGRCPAIPTSPATTATTGTAASIIAGSGIYGEPIVAAAGGTVAYSGWMDSYGYCVFIDHGGGYSTRYAHASALACSAGDTVSAGQTIAYVGSTGNSTGPHLHFEVLQSGSTTNPFEYF